MGSLWSRNRGKLHDRAFLTSPSVLTQVKPVPPGVTPDAKTQAAFDASIAELDTKLKILEDGQRYTVGLWESKGVIVDLDRATAVLWAYACGVAYHAGLTGDVDAPCDEAVLARLQPAWRAIARRAWALVYQPAVFQLQPSVLGWSPSVLVMQHADRPTGAVIDVPCNANGTLASLVQRVTARGHPLFQIVELLDYAATMGPYTRPRFYWFLRPRILRTNATMPVAKPKPVPKTLTDAAGKVVTVAPTPTEMRDWEESEVKVPLARGERQFTLEAPTRMAELVMRVWARATGGTSLHMDPRITMYLNVKVLPGGGAAAVRFPTLLPSGQLSEHYPPASWYLLGISAANEFELAVLAGLLDATIFVGDDTARYTQLLALLSRRPSFRFSSILLEEVDKQVVSDAARGAFRSFRDAVEARTPRAAAAGGRRRRRQ